MIELATLQGQTPETDNLTQSPLAIRGLTVSYGQKPAVFSVDMTVQAGAMTAIIGPNGAGKTTTIRMIMSIIYPDSGTMRVLDHENAESVKDRLGYLPEEKGLYKKMTTGEILTYFGRLKGMDAKSAKKRGAELLERYGLGEWLNKRCEVLSKGMGQKVQILGTLIHDPELVILDEPFSGLDPVNIELMREIILQMKRDGRTVIFSTHIMEQAEQICDAILLINKGVKVIDGPMSEVRQSGDMGIRLDYDGDGSVLRALPGIQRINDAGKHAEIFLEDGVDPQAFLAQLVGKVHIRRFDLREPSLHEIFFRAVGGKADA